jgi:hypothetical protein
MPKAIDGITDKNISTILDGVYDLEKVFAVRSYDELKALLDEHFVTSDGDTTVVTVPNITVSQTKPAAAAVTTAVKNSSSSTVDDDEVKRLLDGLDE